MELISVPNAKSNACYTSIRMISKLFLQDFRNFSKRSFEFSPNITVIVGTNASGKTNILEAVSLLATGKSFKARVEEEMINYKKELARVQGVLSDGTILEIVLTRGMMRLGSINERIARKRILVNRVGKRLVDFAGRLKTVLFKPSDLDIITASPSHRRNFMDSVLSISNYEYRRCLLAYEKGLRNRNRLLLAIRDRGLSRSNLYFWDKLIIKNGNYVSKSREELIDFFNTFEGIKGHNFKIFYKKSAISEERLLQYKDQELAAGTTLVGPHRDDMLFKFEDVDLSRYGSRGEQRMGILWLKMAEMAYIEKNTKEKPTLLLDDIFSELDHEHRALISGLIKKQQTIITTADEHYVVDIKNPHTIKL